MERDLKCMYCAEAGITNTDVFIEIVDVELGAGWICKECFIESEKEKDEHLKELEQQLKAKEQECEELKRQHEGDKGLITATGKQNYQLIQEYDKLKTENEILKEKFEIAIKNNMDKTLLRLEKGDVQEELQEIREQFGIETLYCHVDNTRVHRCLDVLRLKDTLTEIKEIAKRVKVYDPLAKQILQKISEVEDES